MDIGFEKLKQEVEAELGRPIEQGEEITIRALYFFCKGLNLKTVLESEPEQLGKVCERVLEDVGARMERHQSRVIQAMKDFISSKLGRNKKHKENAKEKLLF